MENLIIGNGVHDDTEYIQALLDSGKRKIYLPEPEKCYIISKTLKIKSNTSLVLDRFTEIKLAPQSNCLMLENADGENENISVEGGIWNYNDQEQRENPLLSGEYKAVSNGGNGIDKPVFYDSQTYYEGYLGVAIRFYNVKNLTIKGLAVKDPITFAIQLGVVKYFTVDDITFDFDLGNPVAINTDGIHIDGGCQYGYVTNLKGATYDDLLAINSDDFLSAPISDITVDGIYSEGCHSAVRLLSVVSPVRNIKISNIYGTYYQYAVTISRFYSNPGRGTFSNISFNNIAISKSIRIPELKEESRTWELFNIESGLDIDCLSIENLSRYESVNPIETFNIGENTKIGVLSIRNSVQKNCLDNSMYVMGKGYKGDTNKIPERNKDNNDIVFMINNGEIGTLDITGTQIDGTVLVNSGKIDKIIEN